MSPRVFISYSWSSPGHQARIRQWSEQMVSDGIDVILDVWDLNEGDDMYAFMERMVVDKSVTHVLVFCDSEYSSRADARKAGVGTESQIISREIYSKVQQSKFIPIACEFSGEGEPFLPTFFKSRIFIDFSSPEAANDNWEQLIRVIYGKPAHQKPALGKAPTYLSASASAPASPAVSKFAALKQSLIHNKPGIKHYREDFLEACYSFADALRVRARPDVEISGEKVLEDCGKLKLVRDHVIDWVMFESETGCSNEFSEALIKFLERLLELKSRPQEVNTWSDAWYEAHRVFVYETFLYIVAALIKTDNFGVLHLVLTSHYLLPETDSSRGEPFSKFDTFYGHSDTLQILAPEGKKLHAPAAELIKRQSDRTDLPFSSVMEAELLILMMAFISDGAHWYPQTLHYSSRGAAFPFFLRASRHRDFQKLCQVTGFDSADELREAVKSGHQRLGVERWRNFWLTDRSFWAHMNMEMLDTIN